MQMLKPNSATAAELINVELKILKTCPCCNKTVSHVEYALLCYQGDIWFNCTNCESTNFILNPCTVKTAVCI